MATASVYTVNQAENGQPTERKLVYQEFATREAAQDYITARAQALSEIGWDACIVEHKYEVRFHVTTPQMPLNALGFGARVIEDHDGYRVVSVPSEHAGWLAGRLGSGLWLANGIDADPARGYETREAARHCAEVNAAFAKGRKT